jgi:hypothetical protein
MLLKLKTKQGISNGPAILDENGRILNASNIDQAMHEILKELLLQNQDLFPSFIKTKEDIKANYHAFRSFRRSSDTRALNSKSVAPSG